MPKQERLSVSWMATPVAVALLAAGLVHLILLRHMPLGSDALAYHQEALTVANRTTPYYYPPGMGFYLYTWHRVFGANETVSRAATLVLGAANAWLVVLLTLRSGLGYRVARVAGLLAALYPPLVLLAGQSYSQHLSLVCVTGLAVLWRTAVDQRRLDAFAAAGALAGLACLTRPSTASILAVLAVSGLAAFRAACRHGPAPDPSPNPAAVRHRAIGKLLTGGALCLLAFSLSVLPAMLHNHATGAGFTLSTNNERNFFLGNNPYTPLYKTGHLAQRPAEDWPSEARQYLAALSSESNPRSAMLREAMRHIRQRPDLFVLRCLNRVRAFWGFDYLAARRIQAWRPLSRPVEFLLLAVEAGGYMAVAMLALAGVLSPGHRPLRHTPSAGVPGSDTPSGIGPRGWLLVSLVLAYQLPYTLSFSAGTYHYPIMGLLMPLAAWGWFNLRDGRRPDDGDRTRRSGLPWLAWAAFVALQAEYALFAWLHQ